MFKYEARDPARDGCPNNWKNGQSAPDPPFETIPTADPTAYFLTGTKWQTSSSAACISSVVKYPLIRSPHRPLVKRRPGHSPMDRKRLPRCERSTHPSGNEYGWSHDRRLALASWIGQAEEGFCSSRTTIIPSPPCSSNQVVRIGQLWTIIKPGLFINLSRTLTREDRTQIGKAESCFSPHCSAVPSGILRGAKCNNL
jgi:hypothetical protein